MSNFRSQSSIVILLIILLCLVGSAFISSSSVFAQDNTAIVNSFRLKVREIPNGKLVGSLIRGERVTLIGRNITNDWVFAQADSGLRGWMFLSLLKVADGFSVASLPTLSDKQPTVTPTPDSPTSSTDGSGTGSTGAPKPIVSISARCSREAGNFFDLNIQGGPLPHGLHWQGYKDGSSAGEPSGTTPTYGGTFYTYTEYPGVRFGIRIYGDDSVIVTGDYAEIDCSGQSIP